MTAPTGTEILNSLALLTNSQNALLTETKLNSIAAQIPRFDGLSLDLFGAWKSAMTRYVPDLTGSELFALTRRTLTGPALTEFLEHSLQADGTYKHDTWENLLNFFQNSFLLHNAQ